MIVTNFIRYCKHRRGNIAVPACLSLTAIVLAAGGLLNIMQVNNVRSNLKSIVDAAVTSTARDITIGVVAPEDAEEAIKTFLLANSAPGSTSIGEVVLDKLVINSAAKKITADVSVEFATTFPGLFTGDKLTVRTSTAAAFSDSKREIALILDVTGSMGGNNRIENLKLAASQFIDTLTIGQVESNPTTRISLVPFSEAVNVGPLSSTAVFHEQEKTTGEPPSADTLDPDAAPSIVCASERKGSQAFTDAGPQVALVNRHVNITANIFCPSVEMVPLTSDRTLLLDSVEDLEPSGGTAGQIGIQWGWYMLSQNWANFLPDDAEPAAANAPRVDKYAIIMTDGIFDISYATANGGYNAALANDIARTLCNEMKQDGIEIFTIAFEILNMDRMATNLMRDCASPDRGGVRHFFAASDGDALQATFKEIANNIERLALTQ